MPSNKAKKERERGEGGEERRKEERKGNIRALQVSIQSRPEVNIFKGSLQSIISPASASVRLRLSVPTTLP